jgi:hypothetical protein
MAPILYLLNCQFETTESWKKIYCILKELCIQFKGLVIVYKDTLETTEMCNVICLLDTSPQKSQL